MTETQSPSKIRSGEINYRLIFKITMPMILMSIATHSMMFVDRLMVGKFSIEHMNAMSVAYVIAAVVIFAIIAFANITETFVGQFNGDENFAQIASPVWQTIFIVLACNIILIPLGLFGGEYLMSEKVRLLGIPYFKIIIIFGCLPGLHAALAAFFIARGRSFIVTFSAIIMNILNFILDYLFVFGYENEFLSLSIPPMGVEGAAIGTIGASLVGFIIILTAFLNKENRQRFNTHKVTFNFNMLKKIMRFGLPNSFSHIAEISAWAVITNIISAKSEAHLTVNNIANFIFIIIHFVNAGFEKSTIAISSNLIGIGEVEKTRILINKMLISYAVLIMPTLIMIFFPEVVINFFKITDAYIISEIKIAFYFIWFYSAVDGVNWIYYSILNSGGDTKFTMLLNSISVWLCAVLPIYLGVKFFDLSPSKPWLIGALYIFCIMFFAIKRYNSNKWLKLDLKES